MDEENLVITHDQLDEFLANQQETNDLLQQLVTYNLDQEAKQQEEQQKQEEQAQEEQEQQEKEQKQQEKQDQQSQAQQKALEETRETREVTQAETISEIHDMVDLSNNLMVGQIAFLGIFLGVLLIKIFFDRFGRSD